jgi:hypothetical protein
MKNMTKIAGVAAVALALTQSIQATPITGAIGFGGNVTWDTGSAATATEVTAWSGTQVLSDSGTFASIVPIAPALFNNAVIWHLNDPSTIIANFWQAGGFTFQLNSSFILTQGGTPGVNGFVVVDGTGIVSDGNPADTTTMNWSFTAQDPKTHVNPDQWTFSASTTAIVPDGASTAMLLGIALSGAALLRRKFMA